MSSGFPLLSPRSHHQLQIRHIVIAPPLMPLFQVLIIEFGSLLFSTVPLNIEQWTWSVLLGVGTLLWQQVVTSVPTAWFGRAME